MTRTRNRMEWSLTCHAARAAAITGLAAFLAFASTGCTVLIGGLGALGGAVIDTALVTSPLWGASALEKSELEKTAGNLQAARMDERARPESQWALDSQSTPTICVRFLLAPNEPALCAERNSLPKPRQRYFSGWDAVPLALYHKSRLDLTRAWTHSLPMTFTGEPESLVAEVEIPRERLPEGLRPQKREEMEMATQKRDALTNALNWELRSRSATPEQGALGLWDAGRDSTAFQMTLLAREAIAAELPASQVAVAVPRIAAAIRITPSFNSSFNTSGDAKKDKKDSCADCSPDTRLPQPTRTDSKGILFSFSENGYLARVLPGRYSVHGAPNPYGKPASDQVVIEGRLRAAHIKRTRLLYGVTLPLANALALFGAPISSNRVVMEYDLAAWTGGETRIPLLERTYTIKTDSRWVGIYYGRKIERSLEPQAQKELRAQMRAFAAELRERLRERARDAGTLRVEAAPGAAEACVRL